MSTRRPVAPRAAAARTAGTTAARKPARQARPTSRPGAGSKTARSGSRRTSAEPGRPAVEQPDQPRQVTVRAAMLFVVVLVAFVMLAPTMRAYIVQQEQLRELNDAIAATQERTDALEAAIARWSDDAYVQAQARDRLGFVFPGETPYVVVDPQTVTGEETLPEDEQGPVTMPRTGPWYLTVWDSVQVAGEVGD